MKNKQTSYISFKKKGAFFGSLPLLCLIILFSSLRAFPSSASFDKGEINRLVQGIFSQKDASRSKAFEADPAYKCGTPIINFALKNRELLLPENRFILYRPTSSWDTYYYGNVDVWSYPEQVTQNVHFRIHYTEDPGSTNAVEGEGSEGIKATIPEYVLDLYNYFEYARSIEIGQMGYMPPRSDGSIGGGSGQLDVYVLNITPYGFTSIENGYAYIVVDKDLIREYWADPKGLLKVTAAHEFFHTIQYEYEDWYDLDRAAYLSNLWWEEATAVWMEDEVYDYVNDYTRYLPTRFSRFYIPLDDNRNDPSYFTYSGVIWAKSLAETFGLDSILHMFERCRQINPPLAKTAIGDVLEAYGAGWGEAMSQYALRNLLSDYEEGETYPQIYDNPYYLDRVITSTQIEGGYFSGNNPLSHLALDYIKLDPGNITKDLNIGFSSVNLGTPPVTLLVADKKYYGLPTHDSIDVFCWSFSDMNFVLKGFGETGIYKRGYLIVINPDTWDDLSYSLNLDFNPAGIQAPDIRYPMPGQTIVTADSILHPKTDLSIENIANFPEGLRYTFELYKGMGAPPIFSQTATEDPTGITSVEAELGQEASGYYWRCQAKTLDGTQEGIWTSMTYFYHIVTQEEINREVAPNAVFKVAVDDSQSPIYGASLEGQIDGDTNQWIVISSVINPPITTGNVTPIGDWIYLGPDGLTFSGTGRVTIFYSDAELTSAGVTDPNRLSIFQYGTQNPFLSPAWIKVPSLLDPISKKLSADIDHLSIYAIGLFTDDLEIPNEDPNNNGTNGEAIVGSDSKSGGGCFISTLLKRQFF